MSDRFLDDLTARQDKWASWSYCERPSKSPRTNYISAVVFALSTVIVMLDSVAIV